MRTHFTFMIAAMVVPLIACDSDPITRRGMVAVNPPKSFQNPMDILGAYIDQTTQVPSVTRCISGDLKEGVETSETTIATSSKTALELAASIVALGDASLNLGSTHSATLKAKGTEIVYFTNMRYTTDQVNCFLASPDNNSSQDAPYVKLARRAKTFTLEMNDNSGQKVAVSASDLAKLVSVPASGKVGVDVTNGDIRLTTAENVYFEYGSSNDWLKMDEIWCPRGEICESKIDRRFKFYAIANEDKKNITLILPKLEKSASIESDCFVTPQNNVEKTPKDKCEPLKFSLKGQEITAIKANRILNIRLLEINDAGGRFITYRP